MLLSITTQCNLSCPWCIGKFDKREYKEKINSVINKDTENLIITNIKKLHNKTLTISGGEPLLYPEIVKRIITKCRKEFGDSFRIDVLTNGLLLDKELVDFFNNNNIYLSISLSIFGYKGILNLINKAKCPDILVNLFRNLKYKRFHIVIDKDISFAKEALLLYNLYQCPIEYTPNLIDAFHYDDNDLEFIRKEIKILKTLSKDLSWFKLLYGRTKFCTCTNENLVLDTDGNLSICQPVHGPMYGCKSAHYRMGNDIYNQYCVIVSNLINDTRKNP